MDLMDLIARFRRELAVRRRIRRLRSVALSPDRLYELAVTHDGVDTTRAAFIAALNTTRRPSFIGASSVDSLAAGAFNAGRLDQSKLAQTSQADLVRLNLTPRS